MHISELRNIHVIATDVDGTLTNKEKKLSITAVKAIRKFEEHGIKIILISGQPFPSISLLAQYIGASGPIVAEGGCVVGFPWKPLYVAERKFDPNKVTELMKKIGFEPSGTNLFRLSDLAFHRVNTDISVHEILNYLNKHGIGEIAAFDSGFAVHIQPKNVNKATGLIKALEIINENPKNVLVIGDGENDIPMFKIAGFSATPLDAMEEAKKHAKIVLNKENGEALGLLVEMILGIKR